MLMKKGRSKKKVQKIPHVDPKGLEQCVVQHTALGELAGDGDRRDLKHLKFVEGVEARLD